MKSLSFFMQLSLIAGSGFYSAHLVWILLFPLQMPTAPATIQTKPAIKPIYAKQDSTILSASLFGQVQVAPEIEAPIVVEVTVTPTPTVTLKKLNYWVTMTAEGLGAIVATSKNSQQQYFTLGEQVFDGGILEKVDQGAIYINRGSQTDRIEFITSYYSAVKSKQPSTNLPSMAGSNIDSFNHTTSTKKVTQKNYKAKPKKPNTSAVKNSQKNNPNNVSEKPKTKQKPSKTNTTKINSGDAQKHNQAMNLLNKYGLKPVTGGYQVTPQATLIKLFGLRDNDIIVKINGDSVGIPAQDFDKFANIQKSKKVKVEYLRKGKIKVLEQSF